MKEEVKEEVKEVDESMQDHERAVVRYISGATVHYVHKKFKNSTLKMTSQLHQAKVYYKCCKLLETLWIPEGYAFEHTSDP